MPAGAIAEVHCTYDPRNQKRHAAGRSQGEGHDSLGVGGTCRDAPVRLYDHLFNKPDPDEVPAGQTYLANLNPKSLETLSDCRLEPSLGAAKAGEHFQFERNGYFIADAIDSKPGKPVFNRTVTLKDTWAKIEQKGGGK